MQRSANRTAVAIVRKGATSWEEVEKNRMAKKAEDVRISEENQTAKSIADSEAIKKQSNAQVLIMQDKTKENKTKCEIDVATFTNGPHILILLNFRKYERTPKNKPKNN